MMLCLCYVEALALGPKELRYLSDTFQEFIQNPEVYQSNFSKESLTFVQCPKR